MCVFSTVTHGGVNVCVLYCDPWWCECVCSVLWPMVV